MSEQVAFLDVDTQVDFVEPSGKLYAQGAEAIKENLAALVALARARSIPLVASVDAHGPDDAEFAQFPPHCLKGTPGQEKLPETRSEATRFVPSTTAEAVPDPTREHLVLEKQQFDLFSNPMAEPVLKATGAATFVVFGVVTEVCVRYAVLGLLERGFAVRLVTDAIWPITAEAGDAALAEMQAKGATLTTTAEVLAAYGAAA